MANAYYQLSIQMVFAVKNRDALIVPDFRDTLHKYLGGILVNKKHKPLAINSMPDHIHIFFGMHPNCNLSDLIRDLKSDSSTYINAKKLSKFRFNWQEGYGVFSYSMSHRSDVINYIDNQQIHHRKRTFREEYLEFLRKFDIQYSDEYLFDFFD